MKIKKRYVAVSFFLLLFIFLFVTNPTRNDYLQFSENQIGLPTPTNVEIERVNFYLFSTYTPIAYHEYGMTHIGVFNHFFPISDSQFDYPWWLEFFN